MGNRGRAFIVAFLFCVLSLVLGGLLLSGCGSREEEKDPLKYDVGDCGDARQRGSYKPPVPWGELPVRVRSAHFDVAQEGEIRRALQTWNAFSQGALGRPLFAESASGDHSPEPRYDGDCDPILSGAGELEIHAVTDATHWSGLGLGRQNAGLTLRCYNGGELQRQIVLINPSPDHAFSSQLMSVVLHELGHALGLEHSCDERDRGQEDYLGCSGIDAAHPYAQAVMFPFLVRGATALGSEHKESLRANDQERAHCLYRGR